MKTTTLTILAVTALAGAGAVALAPSAFADGMGFGQRGGMMGMMGPGFGGPQKMFEEFDTNKDGKLTQDEIDAAVDGKYADADKDGQGGVTIAEFEPWFWAQHREMMVRAFQFLDRDGDGSISKDEVTGVTGGVVQRMDRNGDGALTLEDRGRRGMGMGRGDDDDRGGWGERRGRHHGERGEGRHGRDGDGDGPRGWWRMNQDGQGMGPGGGQGMGPGNGQGMGPGNGPAPEDQPE